MAASRSRLLPIALIAVGAVALLDTLDVITFREVRRVLATWWPLIPIGIGAFLLFERRS
ncbi:MAG TPA: DUF5668 domain-containing protein [Burkholderiaceae bacterium]|nr:DUF5668 domain-containing protein [Burkholderiaceae bacterium]